MSVLAKHSRHGMGSSGGLFNHGAAHFGSTWHKIIWPAKGLLGFSYSPLFWNGRCNFFLAQQSPPPHPVGQGVFIDEVSRSHTIFSKTFIHRTPPGEWSARRRDLYLTTHNTHNRQASIDLLWTSDQHVAETSTWQHTTLTTDRHPYDSSGRVISMSQRPLPDNTQHLQKTVIHRSPLDEWSARRRDLYLTTHNTYNRQSSIDLLWTSDRPVAETSTWQHTTFTTDRHP